MKSINLKSKDYLKLPEIPGVYLFSGNDDIQYIGKAKNLKSRVSSYFSNDLGIKTKQMLNSSDKVSYIPVDSEFEALLLEANLVRKNKPKYNVQLRDDKSPLYILITDEDFPRVLSLRQTQLSAFKEKYIFGPFTSASSVRQVLRRLRKIVPYSSHKQGSRPCVRHQIGLCDPCPTKSSTQVDKQSYRKNILKLKNILSGNSKRVIQDTYREINHLSKLQHFEQAKKLLEQVRSLEKLILADGSNVEKYLKNPSLLQDIRQAEISDLKEYLAEFIDIKSLSRIECFDVAHISGAYPTASMVTFIDAEASKKFYRHFKIRQKKSNSDIDSMREVLTRRAKHFESWGKPDLIIVDGGKPQLRAAVEELPGISVVGLAKRYETLVFFSAGKYHERKLKPGPARNLLQRLRDEAHRFARRYHHKLIKEYLIK